MAASRTISIRGSSERVFNAQLEGLDIGQPGSGRQRVEHGQRHVFLCECRQPRVHPHQRPCRERTRRCAYDARFRCLIPSPTCRRGAHCWQSLLCGHPSGRSVRSFPTQRGRRFPYRSLLVEPSTFAKLAAGSDMLAHGERTVRSAGVLHPIALKLHANAHLTRAVRGKGYYDILNLVRIHGVDARASEFREIVDRCASGTIREDSSATSSGMFDLGSVLSVRVRSRSARPSPPMPRRCVTRAFFSAFSRPTSTNVASKR